MNENNYYVELESRVSGDTDMDAAMDDILDGFEGITGVFDVDCGVNVKEKTLTVFLYVAASSRPDAISKAESAFRTAVHASGGFTPQWEHQVDEQMSSKVERTDLVCA